MAAILFTLHPQASDSNGNPISGAKWKFYTTGTSTPRAVYSNSGLSVSLGSTVTADSAGRFVPIFLDASATYRAVLCDASGTPISDCDYDPVNDSSATTASLSVSLAGTGGAALVGKSGSGTVQSHIDLWSTKNYGALPAGTTADTVVSKTFSGHSGGTTDFRGMVYQTTLTGGNSVEEVDQVTAQLELTHSAGTLTRAFGRKAYGRLGLSGSTTGNVTSLRVYDTHVANEGTGTMTTATCYFADGVDLLDGTGPIGTMMAFHAGDQGHATRVTTKAIGYHIGDMTAGAPLTAGIHSDMSSGTNKYALYFEGTAASMFAGGNVAIGSATAPTDMLEVRNGYFKATSSTDFLGAGSYHELRSGNNEFTAKFTNKHASAPEGVHIKFTAATPNDTTQRFLFCDDATATRLIIYSNGNVQNANNSYGAISDRKLKTGIRDAGSQIADIRAIRLRKYKLKIDGPDGRDQLGVIAQELEKVSPGLVNKSPDMEDYFVNDFILGGVGEPDKIPLIGKGEWKSRPTGTYTKSVNYSILYLKAVGALQEALGLIDGLTARIEALEARP